MPPPPPPLPQVHDEVILEGPKETALEAKRLVQQHMANPWSAAIAKKAKESGKPEMVEEGIVPLQVRKLFLGCGSTYTRAP